jgi:serine/threonine protein kinase
MTRAFAQPPVDALGQTTAAPAVPVRPAPAAQVGTVCTVGRVYAGEYLVKGLLGEGGMGEVYLVEHQTLKAELAMKVLKPVYRVREDIVQRFRAEGRALWELSQHDRGAPRGANFVRVHHAGDDPEIGPYMMMEVLAGKTLAQLLENVKRLPLEDALTIAIEVADTAEAMHALGIIHRDLKPENIFLAVPRGGGAAPARKRNVKLLDLGAAKIAKYGQPATAENRQIGTGRYMSPEHIRAQALSPRSDVYALAHITYEMLAGTHAFGQHHQGQPTHFEYTMWHVSAQPTPLVDVMKDCPPELWSALQQAMMKAPEARFASMAAFAGALREILRSHLALRARGGTAKMDADALVDERRIQNVLSSPSPDGAWSGVVHPSGERPRASTMTAEVSTARDPISRGMVLAANAPRSTERIADSGPRPELVAQLVTITGPIAGHRYALARGTYIVGREPPVDLYLNDPSLSARHARIVVHPTGVIEVSDEGSTNGTFVDERPVSHTVAKHGSRVRFGSVVLELQYVDPGRLSFAGGGQTVRSNDDAPGAAPTRATPPRAQPAAASLPLATVPMAPLAPPHYLTPTGAAAGPAPAPRNTIMIIALVMGSVVGLGLVGLMYWLFSSGRLH